MKQQHHLRFVDGLTRRKQMANTFEELEVTVELEELTNEYEDIKEFAREQGVDVDTLWKLINTGKLDYEIDIEEVDYV